MSDRITSFLVVLTALAVAAPLGYAIAGEAQPEPAESLGGVPAEDCSTEVREIYAEKGFEPDTFSYCPSSDQAKAMATEYNLLRRNGLTQQAEAIRKYGGPEDREELAEIERELDALGGEYVYPRNRVAPGDDPANTVDDPAAALAASRREGSP